MPRKSVRFGIQDDPEFPVNRHNAALGLFSELVFRPIAERYMGRIVGINNGTIGYRVIGIDFQEPLNESLFHLQRVDTGRFNTVPYRDITNVRRVKTIPPKKRRTDFGHRGGNIDNYIIMLNEILKYKHVTMFNTNVKYILENVTFKQGQIFATIFGPIGDPKPLFSQVLLSALKVVKY